MTLPTKTTKYSYLRVQELYKNTEFLKGMIEHLRTFLVVGGFMICLVVVLVMYLDWGKVQAMSNLRRVLLDANHSTPPHWAVDCFFAGITIAIMYFVVGRTPLPRMQRLATESYVDMIITLIMAVGLIYCTTMQKTRESDLNGVTNDSIVLTETWDNVQQEFECCGIIDDRNYKKVVLPDGKQVPSSCCIYQNVWPRFPKLGRYFQKSHFVNETICQSSDPNIYVEGRYKKGCLEALKFWLHGKYFFVMCLYGAAIFFIQLKMFMQYQVCCDALGQMEKGSVIKIIEETPVTV